MTALFFCSVTDQPVAPAPSLPKAIVYIDGFNFYYGAIKGTPHKWLNLEKLAEGLVRPQFELVVTRYFTSIMDGSSGMRQSVFLGALSTLPRLRTVLGKFKPRSVTCIHQTCSHSGSRVFQYPEEKRTDVAIATAMIEDAYENRCDKFVVISGDSDLVPAVQLIRRRFLEKRITVYTPTQSTAVKGRRADELTHAAGDGRSLPLALLAKCYFPDEVAGNGSTVYKKPPSW